ncbi:MAG: hypothetical protein DRJ67_03715 [Thermoprotei archaeon]|nr:MAG: hypothetical protein DRJ67_03715 [Thermoprotei archaeon]
MARKVDWNKLLVITAVVVNMLNSLLLMRTLMKDVGLAYYDEVAAELAREGRSFTAYVVSDRPVMGALKRWRVAHGLWVSKVEWRPGLPLPPGSRVYAYDEPGVSIYSVFPSPLPRGTVNPVYEVHGIYGTRYRGRGVRVVVVDTGVDYTHPDLRGAVVMLVSFVVQTTDGRPLVWVVGVNGTLDEALEYDRQVYESTGVYAWLDENGHGTHVCGIIAGRGVASAGRFRGVAPSAKLIVVKAFSKAGTTSVDLMLDALTWIADHVKADVVNLSFGTRKADPESPLALAAARLAERGMIVVAAAGNEGQVPGTILSPASSPEVLAIAAYDPFNGVIAPFSSMGPSRGADKPDFAAVGVSVCAAFPTYTVELEKMIKVRRVMGCYACLSGTSMATAVATGIVALHVEARWPAHRVTEDYLAEYALPVQLTKGWLAGHGLLTAP